LKVISLYVFLFYRKFLIRNIRYQLFKEEEEEDCGRIEGGNEFFGVCCNNMADSFMQFLIAIDNFNFL